MEFWLYDQANNTRQTLEVNGTPITVGRDADCTIQLRGPFIARKHAKIALKGNTLFVENLSRSSLRVAGRDIEPDTPVRLDFGDEVQISQFSLALVRPGKEVSDAEQRRQMQRRLVAFEQLVHQALIERLNLRITGHLSKNDPAYAAQVNAHLEQILDQQAAKIYKELMHHMVQMHLGRLVTADGQRRGVLKRRRAGILRRGAPDQRQTQAHSAAPEPRFPDLRAFRIITDRIHRPAGRRCIRGRPPLAKRRRSHGPRPRTCRPSRDEATP